MKMVDDLFLKKDEEKYIFKINSIVRTFTYKKVKNIADGEELFKLGRVTVKKVNIEKKELNIMYFETSITDFDETLHTVKMKTYETNLLSSECFPKHSDHNYYGNRDFFRSACKYEYATLLAMNEYIKQYNPGDTTDYSASVFMNSMKSFSRKNNAEEKNKDIFFEVKLNVETQGGYYSRDDKTKVLSASFKIGTTKKMYILKDIPEMIDIYKNGGKLKLGKLVELDFSKSDFSDKCKKIINVIEKWSSEDRNLRKKFGHSYVYDSIESVRKTSIIFDESMLDEFYDVLSDISTMRDLPIEKEEKKLRIKVKINPTFTKSTFNGADISFNLPEMFKGTKYFYTLHKKDDKYIFNRIPYEQSDFLKKLISEGEFFNKKSNFEMHIGTKRISEFVNKTIPVINEFVNVDSEGLEKISEYLPPKPEIHFYLDAADGVPACYLKSVYNNNEYDFTDHLKDIDVADGSRDYEYEQQALNVAMKYFNVPEPEKSRIICESDDSDRIYSLISEGLDELQTYGTVHTTNSFDSIHIKRNYSFSMNISIENNLLNLDLTSTDFSPKELIDIMNSYRSKKKYHLMKNGNFVQLDERVSELALMMDTMNISVKDFVKGKMQFPSYRALYIDKMLEECQDIHTDRDKHYKELIRNYKTVKDSDFEVPCELKNIMREYQKYGYRWLKTLETYNFGGILADDMGLGKTLQIISVLFESKKENPENNVPSLIICPASLIYNWYEEFQKFAPEMKILTISGIASERKNLIKTIKDYDVAVTSYDLLKRDIAEYEDKNFFYQIIDEAQYIKNHSTSAAKSVKLIRSKYRFALTGTPIENRLSELWSIFDYLMPGFLYGYETFRREIEIPIVKREDEQASSRLKKIVSPFILRRLKTDVLKDLPEKIEKTQYSKFESEQQKIYDAQVFKIQQMLEKQDDENFQKNKLQILAELTKIRQICCDPSLIYENYNKISAKREACLELVKNAIDGKHRILIFSQFTSMLDILAKDFQNENIPFFKIVGNTPKEKRIELVNEFNGGDVPVFLISLKAGGTGLNLTGADVVIHFDPWWNIAAQNQATDRAYRIGQKNEVTVYKLIIKNTIEEKIQKMQEKKKNLAESILNSESVNISSLNKKELLELFEL